MKLVYTSRPQIQEVSFFHTDQQDTDPEIAVPSQEYSSAFWRKPLSLFSLIYTHDTHKHTTWHFKQVFQFHSWTPRGLIMNNWWRVARYEEVL